MLQKNLLIKCDDYLKKHRTKLSALAFLLFLGILSLQWINHNNSAEKHQFEKPEALETYIPLGFTLIPIEILNVEQLQSMIDDRAVVDLFTPGNPLSVAKAVKLVRSPMDENVFGILVEDNLAQSIMKYGNQFVVAIKNRQSKKPAPKQNRKRQIYYEES